MKTIWKFQCRKFKIQPWRPGFLSSFRLPPSGGQCPLYSVGIPPILLCWGLNPRYYPWPPSLRRIFLRFYLVLTWYYMVFLWFYMVFIWFSMVVIWVYMVFIWSDIVFTRFYMVFPWSYMVFIWQSENNKWTPPVGLTNHSGSTLSKVHQTQWPATWHLGGA